MESTELAREGHINDNQKHSQRMTVLVVLFITGRGAGHEANQTP